VRLGAALGVAVVAEGIEDPRVAQRLAHLGCPLGQGFLFGTPQPVTELAGRFSDLVPDRTARGRAHPRSELAVGGYSPR
jgi:EAL domain-containing protein (putative c-di-GMP-specific phosphodiesterase class I)